MNFNFNFKDMPREAGPSIRCVTNARDRHHTGKSGIKRSFRNVSARVIHAGTVKTRQHMPYLAAHFLKYAACSFPERTAMSLQIAWPALAKASISESPKLRTANDVSVWRTSFLVSFDRT